jgi:hypothetical protein
MRLKLLVCVARTGANMPQMAKATDDGLTGTYSRPEVGFWEGVFRTMRPESRPDGTRKRRFNKRRVKNQLRLGTPRSILSGMGPLAEEDQV